MKKLRLALWGLVIVALFSIGVLAVLPFMRPEADAAAGPTPGASLGGAFTLVDQDGAPVTEDVFRGKPSVTLFGFTHCPDVCPTGLSDMAKWQEQLGTDADKLRFVFVTVDPERDTPAMMRDYVRAFSDNLVGVSGPPEAVHAMVKDYKIFSRKVPLDGDDYTMDHTASMILQDASGNFVGTIDPSEPRDTGLAKLKRLVAG